MKAKEIDLKQLPLVTIRLTETVVQIMPDGMAIKTKAGREVEAWKVADEDGDLKLYLVLGTSGIPRMIPPTSAEEIGGQANLN